MGTFVGLDVSLKATSICVLDEAGTISGHGRIHRRLHHVMPCHYSLAAEALRVYIDAASITDHFALDAAPPRSREQRC